MTFPHRIIGSLRPAFAPVSHVCVTVKQAFTFTLHNRFNRPEPTFVLLRYSLGGDRPSQTSSPTRSYYFHSQFFRAREDGVSLALLTKAKSSHLRYTPILKKQCRSPVKVHGVFPSNRKKSASARTFQFQWTHVGDSEEVVTPFMRVGTYPTRNFATLGPSELRPPFT